jgi:hypothetical protein
VRLLALFVAALVAACDVAPAYPTADLVISPQGAFSLDGKPVAEQDLMKELKALRERAPDAMLAIRTDLSQWHPKVPLVRKAMEEAGIQGGNIGAYREQERARKIASWRNDILFFGGIMLFCVLVVVPFALRAKSAAKARSTSIAGIGWLGCFIGAAIGGYMDYKSHSRGQGVWLTSVFMLIYFVPLSLVTGVITGSICSLIVRRREKAAAPTPR